MAPTHPDGIRNQRDVEAIEARGEPMLPASTYEMISRGAMLDPEAPALSFLATLDDRQPSQFDRDAPTGVCYYSVGMLAKQDNDY